MKRILIILAMLVLLAGCTNEKLILSTDSAELIFDGVPMQAYTIGGARFISVEGLADYGFTITDSDGVINAVGDERIVDLPDTSDISRTINEVGKAKKSKKTIQINSMRIDAYEADGVHYVGLDKLCEFRTDYNREWGYSDYNFVSHNENGKFIVDVFRLKLQNDVWDRQNEMINKPEMDVYTEDYTCRSVPYFGARLEPPSGIYAGVNGDDVFESDHLGASLNYVEFTDFQKDILQPNRDYVKASSCLVVIAWNINDLMGVFENEEYIRETLDNLSKYHKPMIIRIGAEMNVSHLGDAPAAFVNAFRMIADIVHEYPDFAVMWSPNDMGALNKPFEYYYPGDEYVDWIGVSSFMKKHFLGDPSIGRDGNVYFMTGEFAYTTNTLKNITDFMHKNDINKPLAISEGGTVTQLNYANGGEIDEWSKERIGYMYWYAPMRYPQLKIINYFNHLMEEEVQFFNMHDKPELLERVNDALGNGQYRSTAYDMPEFTFMKLDGFSQNQTTIPLYTYAYLPEESIQKVEYILDGNVVSECHEIPYYHELTTQYIPEGSHTLTVRVTGSSSTIEQEYSLTREGHNIKIIK